LRLFSPHPHGLEHSVFESFLEAQGHHNSSRLVAAQMWLSAYRCVSEQEQTDVLERESKLDMLLDVSNLACPNAASILRLICKLQRFRLMTWPPVVDPCSLDFVEKESLLPDRLFYSVVLSGMWQKH
jgi:hypothetical protein